MKIIIIGNGKVGYNLAENLSKEDNDVTLIDKNVEALKKADEYLDVMCIRGNGLSTRVLLEAGVKDADLLISVTNSDEINMVCCLTAKKLGVCHTIARIRDPEYADELSQLKEDLSLDMVINPEQAVAVEISRLLEFPPAIDVEMFARGRVEMVKIIVTREMSILNKSLKDIANRISPEILIGGVIRDNDIIIPKGSFVIEENDKIYIVGRQSEVFYFCMKIGIHIQKIKSAMIMGGGRIAYYLAKYLDGMGIKVKIIEIDRKRCVELTELLNNVLIINGDASEEDILLSENLREIDAFISVTGRDEENLMAALLAKQHGVKKVVAKINRTSYAGVIKNLGLNNVVSPKLITANYILRYVRGLQNAMGNPVNSLYRIMNDKAEAIEFTANQFTKVLNIPLSKLDISDDILVATIVRNHKIIIPHGNDVIKSGDNVILIVKERKLIDLNDIVA